MSPGGLGFVEEQYPGTGVAAVGVEPGSEVRPSFISSTSRSELVLNQKRGQILPPSAARILSPTRGNEM